MVVGLVKLVLQGLEGNISPVLGGMVTNELYLVSFVMQLLACAGLCCASRFGNGGPSPPSGLLWWSIPSCFSTKSRTSAMSSTFPNIVVCGAAAWILLKHGRGPFAAVARVTAVILVADAVIMTFRAVLTDMFYRQADLTDRAHTDPKWVYSLAGMAFLAHLHGHVRPLVPGHGAKQGAGRAGAHRSLTGALNRRAMEETASARPREASAMATCPA